ncbi:MAG: kynureninase [Rubrobacter sp.]|nr:kynureninase [Rubrobacter sp.]
MTRFDPSENHARTLDENDEIAHLRDEFYLTEGEIYLDGNSLGLLSRRAEKTLLAVLEDWKRFGIGGWTNGERPWFYLSERLGEMTAPLVGASPDEVVATGSTTVNIHQLASTFFRPEGKRTKILATELDFPTDIHALGSQLSLRNLDPSEHLAKIKSRDGRTISEDDAIAAMTDDVALILLPTVLYRSGQLLDIERLTKAAHERNILIGFDAAHSIGSVPHRFSEWGVDFAVWCSYKHLNGGPGAAAGLYVNRKHFRKPPGLAGWFGSEKGRQFDMAHEFASAASAGAFQIGTPNVMSLAPLLGSLEMFEEAGMEAVREKSLRLTGYLMELAGSELSSMGFFVGTPGEGERRGGHVALEHEEAARICEALKERGVVPDFRAPNVVRLAPVALYTSYLEVWEAVRILKGIMAGKAYEKFENTRGVTA